MGLNWCRVGNFETAAPGKGGKAAEGGGVIMVFPMGKLWYQEEWTELNALLFTDWTLLVSS